MKEQIQTIFMKKYYDALILVYRCIVGAYGVFCWIVSINTRCQFTSISEQIFVVQIMTDWFAINKTLIKSHRNTFNNAVATADIIIH